MKKNILKILLALPCLLLTACSLMGGEAELPDPLNTKVDKKFEGKVIIVGAGAAGLSAANVLEANGVDYEILEATNRYGGRILANNSFADFPIDEGAEWIHDKKAILNRLKGSENQEPEEDVILYQPMDIFVPDGASFAAIPKYQLWLYYQGYQEYKFKKSSWFYFIENNFAKNVEDNIRYNSLVKTIDYTGNKVILTTENGTKYEADKVIVTVSIGVLQSNKITFKPTMSAKKLDAINAVSFPKGFKLFLKFDEKFYPDMINFEKGASEAQKVFYDVAYHKDSKQNILGLLVLGDSAQEYYKLGGKDKIVAKVLDELDAIFPKQASKLYNGQSLMRDWGSQPYVMGTYTDNFDERHMLKELNKPLDNKVFFAGESNAPANYRSMVHGAIVSGNQVAKEILSAEN